VPVTPNFYAARNVIQWVAGHKAITKLLTQTST
jgi:hypothetical protein